MAVTRADVARTAGVSPAVVSYVLNNGPRPVSASARERVQEAVQVLGYRPNRLARALRANRSRSIGMLMPDHVNPHFAELAQAVEDEAFARDQVLLFGTTSNDAEHETTHLRALLDHQIDGLLLISSLQQPDTSGLEGAGMPTVLLDRAPAGSRDSTVAIDNRGAALTAVRHLLSHHRVRPAAILGPQGISAVLERRAGWDEALVEARLREVVAPEHEPFSREGGYAAASRLLRRPAGERPDALFVASDAQAIGAVRACLDLGLRVPEDVALVSIDGSSAGRFMAPSITSVVQDVAEIARVAVATLLERIEHPDGPAIHEVLEAELRLGESCGCGGAVAPSS